MRENRSGKDFGKAGDARKHRDGVNFGLSGETPAQRDGAVQSGADAVCADAGKFNARRMAGNFGKPGDAREHRSADDSGESKKASEHRNDVNSGKSGKTQEHRSPALPELLCPAGSAEAMVAAVQNGADSVYLGAGDFNARRTAENFEGALDDAVRYCQVRGVRVYVTLNTMVRQDELSRLEATIEEICRAGADGVIVSDLGTARAIREMAPSLPLHASTQMAAHNPQAVEFLAEQGFKRVVLAREMSFEEIARCANLGAELEVFVHGALCVSCSGQCLMSSMIGGRSGNRGLCAQPCRQRYELDGREGYLLSTRDLCGLGNLRALSEAGAASLKIEGRLKRPEYVAQTAAIYRAALDALGRGEGFDGEIARRELAQLFNRGGFTRGYGPGLAEAELMYRERPNHLGVEIGRCKRDGEIELTAPVDERDALALRRGKGEAKGRRGGWDGAMADARSDFSPEAAAPTAPFEDIPARMPSSPAGATSLPAAKRDAHAGASLRESLAEQARHDSSPEAAAPAAHFEDIPARMPASLPAVKRGAHAGTSLRESLAEQARHDSSPEAAAPAAPFEDIPARMPSSPAGATSLPTAKRGTHAGTSLRASLAEQARHDSSPEAAAPAAHFEDIPVRMPASPAGAAFLPTAKCGDRLVRLTSEAQLRALRASYSGEMRKFPVDAKLLLRVGELARLTLRDGMREVCVEGEIVQAARSRPADPERIRAQIAKLGDTPFELRGWSAEIDENAYLPVSALNELRRRGAEALLEARRNPPHHCGKLALPELSRQPRVRPELIAQSGDPELLRRAIVAGADFACFAPEDLRADALDAALERLPERFDLALPPVMGEGTLNALHAWAEANARHIRRTLIANIGQFRLNWPGELAGDFMLNIANDLAVAQLSEWGATSYVPSVELNRAQIEALGGRRELIVYGRIPLMQLRHCPLRAAEDMRGLHRDCRRCDGCSPSEQIGAKALTDRLGARFPLRRISSDEGCVVQLLNSATLMLLRRRGNLPAAQAWRLLLGPDDPIEAVVRLHKIALDGGDPRSDADWPELDALNATTGHYFRGAE